MACLESTKHAVLIYCLGFCFVSSKATRIVNQLTVIFLVVPLRSQWLAECSIDFYRRAVQRSPEPDVKEVHQVGIWNGIIVWWICNDNIETWCNSLRRTLFYHLRSRRADIVHRLLCNLRHPFSGPKKSSAE